MERKRYGEVLTLLVETVAGVAAGVVLILDVGTRLPVTDVEGNVAVIASELRVKDMIWSNLRILESGEGNRKSIVDVARSKHLSLSMTKETGKDVLVHFVLREEDREAVSEQGRTLPLKSTQTLTCPLIRNLIVVTHSPFVRVVLLEQNPFLL